MKMFIAGDWRTGARNQDVCHAFTGEVLDTVPMADPNAIEEALTSGVAGAVQMRQMPAWDRSRVLVKVANLLEAQAKEIAAIITREEGKTITEATAEVARAVETMRWSGEEAKRLFGETLPLDAAPGGAGKFGYAERIPCGLVVAISPFNFPLNLVCHKVGPALAAGNAVILKPASATPLTALRLTELLLEAGLPPLGIQCITGSGSELGAALCRDGRVRKITFTGSSEVGEAICRVAGVKKVTMELGSNSPLIVLDDADLELAVTATVATGFANAGQICISTQRVILHHTIAEEFSARLTTRVLALKVGNPELPDTTMGPMITAAEAARVRAWIAEAVKAGAQALISDSVADMAFPEARKSGLLAPEVLSGVTKSMRVWREEVFGPVVCLTTATSFDEALAKANDSRYGLSAAVFTKDIDRALAAARSLDSGNIHVNWGPGWRADMMPYGGLKGSGIGREGPRYAMQEMTELKTVVIHTARCTD